MAALPTVDVRDMLCAQALAVVGRAVEALHHGERLDVRYNAEDVRRDLWLWATDRGHRISSPQEETLRIERG